MIRFRKGRYRIVKHHNSGNYCYEVKKRSFIGIWYNFKNIDACITGVYETEAEARKAIDDHGSIRSAEIIFQGYAQEISKPLTQEKVDNWIC